VFVSQGGSKGRSERGLSCSFHRPWTALWKERGMTIR
jgi:hypothetical protein